MKTCTQTRDQQFGFSAVKQIIQRKNIYIYIAFVSANVSRSHVGASLIWVSGKEIGDSKQCARDLPSVNDRVRGFWGGSGWVTLGHGLLQEQ